MSGHIYLLLRDIYKKLKVKTAIREKAVNTPDEKPAKVIANALVELKDVEGITGDGDIYSNTPRINRRM